MIARVTLRGLLARRARIVLTVLSIVIGVSFVSGAFILTDSFRRSFDQLFAQLDEGIDLRVRGATAFGRGGGGSPVPAELADEIRRIPGVVSVEPNLDEPAVVLAADGEPLPARGGPQLGVSWTGEGVIGGRQLRSGELPSGVGEVNLDEGTAERIGAEVGDTVRVAVADGVREFVMVGTNGLGDPDDDDRDATSRATIAAFDPITAQEVLGSPGLYDSIDIAVDDGRGESVAAAVEALLTGDAEVVTGDVVARESAERIGNAVDLLRWVLLGFALIALFVSAFLINNTFRIIVGQRLRELALLRAVGASGRQVRTMILGESLAIAVLATSLGLLGGVGVAKALTAVFNAGGAAFPRAGTVIAVRTVVVATFVGVGVTLAASIAPAISAGRVPPVAAMRLEAPPSARRSLRRDLVGGLLVAVGVAVYCVGVFRKPGELSLTVGVIAAGGAVTLVGVALLAAGLAAPVGRALGVPVRRLLRMPGRLAQENAARSPRRTATTASALMIGIALVSGVGVVGASLSRSLSEQLGQSVTADFFFRGVSFQGFSPTLVDRVRGSPRDRGGERVPQRNLRGRRRRSIGGRRRQHLVRPHRRSRPARRRLRGPRRRRPVVARGSGTRLRPRCRRHGRGPLAHRHHPDPHRRRSVRRCDGDERELDRRSRRVRCREPGDPARCVRRCPTRRRASTSSRLALRSTRCSTTSRRSSCRTRRSSAGRRRNNSANCCGWSTACSRSPC